MSVPFRELEVWQVSMRLASTVHLLSAGFAEGEHAALALSLQQASAAIPVDIAEGHGAACLHIHPAVVERAGCMRTRDERVARRARLVARER